MYSVWPPVSMRVRVSLGLGFRDQVRVSVLVRVRVKVRVSGFSLYYSRRLKLLQMYFNLIGSVLDSPLSCILYGLLCP